MVRHYVKKKDNKPQESKCQEAIFKMENENLSQRAAAKAVHIPK